MTGPPRHRWTDADHCARRARIDPRRAPISIYAVHAGSWDRDEQGHVLDWDRLAERLIPYVVDLGFTHVEFLPIGDCPDDQSGSCRTAGLYAPAAPFGDHEGFARLVDEAHRAGVGILLDWAPARFSLEAHGLARFDGTALYEQEDSQPGARPDGEFGFYDLGRPEVVRFLVDNALWWAGRYHVDGLRIEAVTAMLYHDYGHADDGHEAWHAVEFLRTVHHAVDRQYPGVFTIAEESTAWPGITLPADEGGLGFGFKWNRGWMHDTLQYFGRDAVHRRDHHADIAVGFGYAFAESFVLPLSHDVVAPGKGSLLARMAGDDWQQFANLRALYGLMWGHPGKKLLFMGQEFAQRRDWSEARALDWDLRFSAAHEGVRTLVRDLNRLYRDKAALHRCDADIDGFAWLVADDAEHSVFAWVRRTPGATPIVVIANLTPIARTPYRLPLPIDGRWQEIFNSDDAAYWGTNLGNPGGVVAVDGAAWIILPPLATIMLERAE